MKVLSNIRRHADEKKRQRGLTVPMVAIFIFVLFGLAAISVDVGILLTARTSAQHAADSAALAGAYTFVSRPTAPQPDTAIAAATAVALSNQIVGKPVTSDMVAVSVPDVAFQRVTVTIDTNPTGGITVYFAKAIGGRGAVKTEATAEASTQTAAISCLKPFYLPNNALPGNLNIINPSTGQVTPDAISAINSGTLLGLWGTYVPGSSSQRELLNLSMVNGHDKSTLDCSISSCAQSDCGFAPINCNEPLNVYTGNKNGIVGPDLTALISNADGSTDTWVGPDEYHNDILGNVSMSRSVMTIAVWDTRTPIGNGSQATVTTIGFAQVFVNNVDSAGNTQVRLVSVSSCGTGNGGGTGTGPAGIPVRLVQNPS